jgi:NADH-quinone oxidoreductase subunit L
MTMLYALWLLPLAGALVLWAFGPQIRERGGWVGSGFVFASFAAALASFSAASEPHPGGFDGPSAPLVTWIPGFKLGLMLDPLSLVWALIITGVGGLIHFYAIGYMAGDRAVSRFFAYMNFFVFAMLTVVLSDNFLGLLVGWGLVGLASYFLIGFWFDRPSAVAAARKAFVINVVGDVGLMFAVFVLFSHVGSIAYVDVFAKAPSLAPNVLFLACACIFIGCAAKSAQVPLHTWLPDAMEGPTPVSALIHAATMVTAGVYLVARCAPMWNASADARELAGVIGAVTALAAAVLGIAQWDIKRVLAYSTMSQIGYMIMGVGVGAYGAGVLHFFTHAFFKAQLFLAAGLIIHALGDEQDIRKMGGLRRRMPFAFWTMLIGTMSICGVPELAGYFSKDAVLYGALVYGHPYLYAVGVLTAAVTAYYMFRMFFIVFFGPDRAESAGGAEHGHGSNVPDWVMQAPVALLTVGAVVSGYIAIGGENSPWSRLLAPDFSSAGGVPTIVPPFSEHLSTLLVFVVVAVGFALAYARYASAAARADSVARLAREAAAMPQVLVRGYYVDDLIEVLFVRPAQALGREFGRFVDPHLIDGAVRDTAWLAGLLGLVMRRLQNGLVRAYAISLVVGVVCFLAYYAFAGIAR